MRKLFLFILFLTGLTINLSAQTESERWRDHLPYAQANKVADAGDRVYCSTSVGLFYYNKVDESVVKLTKISGLSDVGIATIRYNYENELLVIVYENANIDLMSKTEIYNISDIQRKQIAGKKNINNILFIDDYAYFSCAFGIVQLNLTKKEIGDTYIIGDGGNRIEVFELAFDGTYLYAATENGLYKALYKGVNLLDFNNWKRITDLPNYNKRFNSVVFFDNKIYTSYKGIQTNRDTIYFYSDNRWNTFGDYYHSDVDYHNVKSLVSSQDRLIIISDFYTDVFDLQRNRIQHAYDYVFAAPLPKDAIFDADKTMWIADGRNGLIRAKFDWNYIVHYPNGPYDHSVVRLSLENNKLWAASGGQWSKNGVYTYADDKWTSYNEFNTPEMKDLLEIIDVQVDPQNSNHVFACSWGYGLLEFNEGKLVKVHDQTNSTLYPVEGFSSGYVRIGCATFDKENNLWIGNSAVQNPISVKKADGTWFNFPKAEYGSIIGRESLIDDIIVTQNGYKWGVLRNGGGLFAFSEGENIDNEGDDKFKAFSVNDKDGHAITSRVYSIAEDLEGVIWLGTEKGIVVYYNPNNVFSKEEGAFFGQQVRVHAEGNDSILQDLLGTEKVNAIAVDGANRKWFATENAGVFLMSEDGTEQIYHFNIANSPLLSNNVLCIAINHTTGEVFFGTEKGIISFMGTATKGDTFFREVLVFPNPVKPNFDGVITIKGLITNVNVKISDIAGHLVYETTSHGGQATWDGKGFDGARVQTGVYLVFCTNEDGSKTYITKILFIN